MGVFGCRFVKFKTLMIGVCYRKRVWYIHVNTVNEVDIFHRGGRRVQSVRTRRVFCLKMMQPSWRLNRYQQRQKVHHPLTLADNAFWIPIITYYKMGVSCLSSMYPSSFMSWTLQIWCSTIERPQNKHRKCPSSPGRHWLQWHKNQKWS